MKVYDGASWITATSAGATSLLRFRYVATSGQTTFSGADAASATLTYTVNNITVCRNGVTLDTSEYTASNGTSVVLTVAAGTGDIVDITAFKSFTVADALSAVSGGTVNGAVTVTGVTTVQAGTAALPAITTSGDTNTGIFFPAADTIAFSEGGTEAMRIDSDGDVGIGTASPTNKLHVSSSSFETIKLQGTSTVSGINFVNSASSNGYIYYDNGPNMLFYINGSERMRIDSSGNLLSANGTIQFTSAQYRSNVASSQLQFINNSAGVSLAVNGTSWGSLSDERDKEIIEPIADATSKVASLRSVIGRYKVDDADKRRAFLIAQDVKAVLPEAVTELEDEQQTLILQYTEVIPLLVAAINEQQALITSLTARITALENT
jgi:hypothetical protein